jgi:hypothetical protein
VGGSYPFGAMRLAILNVASGALRFIRVPLSHPNDLAWAPNSRQLLVAGADNPLSSSPFQAVFLVDTHLGDYQEIVEFTGLFVPSGSDDSSLSWSPDGETVVFHCLPPDLVDAAIALCQSRVRIGGAE